MSRSPFVRVLLVCLGIAVLDLGLTFWFAPRRGLNVILVTLDTTRADRLGCYGYSAALTPTLDELAARGVLFERAYAPAPLTLPAHASIHTGLYPPEHGLLTNGRDQLHRQIPTLAETLAERGYATGAFVGSFVLNRRFGLDRGFQTYGDDFAGTLSDAHGIFRQRSADQVIDEALAWLTRRSSRPFFCWLHVYDPHYPYLDHQDVFGSQFRDRPYDAELAFVDMQLRRLLDFLESRKLRGKTLIVIAGDHGEGLGAHGEREHGYLLYDSTLRVPLIVSLAERYQAGLRVTTPVTLVDLTPTILDCLELPTGRTVSGRSLKPALSGVEIPPLACYAGTDEPFLNDGWSPLRSLITQDWKYIQTTRPELYELRTDPLEARNLAESQPERMTEMRQQLQDMVAGFIVRKGAGVTLSVAEQRALASLGYLGGQAAGGSAMPDHALPDVKEMIGYYTAWGEARDLLEAGELEQAAAKLRAIIAAVPDYVAPQLLLSEILSRQGQTRNASLLLSKILEQDPGHREANTRLANLHAAEGHFADALPCLQRALERDPDSAELHYSLGEILRLQDRSQEALTEYRAAVKLDPNAAPARIRLGDDAVQHGDSSAALKFYAAAVRVDPNSVEGRFSLGQILSGSQRYAEAATHFARAVELDPLNPEMHYNLAIVLAHLQKLDDALPHLQETLRLQPDHPRAGHLLREVQTARRYQQP